MAEKIGSQATIKDVARRAGVSTTTVSRYLNGFAGINPDTRERIGEAIAALNYRTNIAARGLVTKTTRIVGVMALTDVDDFFNNAFFMHVLKGISRTATAAHYDVLLSTAEGDAEEILADWVHGRRIDGVVLLRSRVNEPAMQLIQRERFPAVVLGRPCAKEVSYVDNNNVTAAYAATKHLLDLGHQRVAFIGGAPDLAVTEDRLLGYRQALAQASLEVDEAHILLGRYEWQSGYNLCSTLLQADRPPTAIVASDDGIAIGALQAAHDLGQAVPDDVSVIGFNDIPASEFSIPPLTTVEVHMEQLGTAVAEILLQQIANPERAVQRVIVKTRIILRSSTGRAPAAVLSQQS